MLFGQNLAFSRVLSIALTIVFLKKLHVLLYVHMHTCVQIHVHTFSHMFMPRVSCNGKAPKATTKTEKALDVGCGGSLAKTIRVRFPSRETNSKDRH